MSEEMKKPEWFELTDGDAPSALVSKVNKKLPIAAVLITGAVIATGAFFASASENQASAEGTTQNSTASNSSTGSTGSTDKSTTSGVTSTSPSPVASPGVQNPAQGGITDPGAIRGDGDGDHKSGEGREHDGDRGGDHEGRDDRD
jgi:hypothetical protein